MNYFKQFEKFIDNKFDYELFVTINGDSFTLEDAIISVIDYQYYFNISEEEGDRLSNRFRLISQYLKDATIKMIGTEDGYIYRGLNSSKDDFIYEDDYYIPVASWTTDYDIANSFYKPQEKYGQVRKSGLLLKKSIAEYKDKILFSMDIFMKWVKEYHWDILDSEWRRIVDGYITEHEIVCLP
jgi:hypothetical protein